MVRPRKFDEETVLGAAMGVFWAKGYEGTTIEDLTTAMGINRPSLYGTFGNKAALFQRALARYAAGPASYITRALEAPTARACTEKLLRGAIDLCTHPEHPGGCLAVHGALVTGSEGTCARDVLNRFRADGETAIRDRFKRAQDEGELPATVDHEELARYFTVVLRGMAVEAAGGATRGQLYPLIALAMRAWPT